MGVGVSSLRLRKALILRSYNLRKEDQTMEEQFSHLGERGEDGEYYISLDGVKDYLGFGESSQVEGTYRRLLGGSLIGTKVLYTDFVEFLETGKTAENSASNPSTPRRTGSKMRILKNFPSSSSSGNLLPVPGKTAKSAYPPGSPEEVAAATQSQTSTNLLREKHEKALKLAQTLASADYTDLDGESANADDRDNNDHGGDHDASSSSSTSRSGGANKQSEGTPEPKGSSFEGAAAAAADDDDDDDNDDGDAENNHDGEQQQQGGGEGDDVSEYDGPEPIIEENDDDDDDDATAGANVMTREVIVHPHAADHNSMSFSSNSVWRKREVVKQEREVYYTTVDATGQLQELVEKETSQTEVLHMESRDTGEFAHRETTVYKQLETFNDEVVSEQTGAEEYVHLKSENDEFEHVESNMPNKKGAGGGDSEAPSSPRVGDDAAAGAGASMPGGGADFAAAADAQGGYGNIDLSGVNPEDLDEETRNYFLYVLKQQQEEATHRLAAMRQQEDLGEQYRAFEGLSDADLDDETRAYREYLEQSMANIAKYLSEDIGVGVRNVMVMMSMDENERKGEGGEPVEEERETMDDEEGREGGAAASNINGAKTADNYNGNGNGTDGEDHEGKYEEPDSPLPADNWTREFFTTDTAAKPAAGAPAAAVPDLDNDHADADIIAAAAAVVAAAAAGVIAEGEGAAAEEEEEVEEDQQSAAASMHDID